MAKRLSARIRSKNQITLPQRLVQHIGLQEGDFLDFEIISTAKPVEPGMIVLRTKKLVEASIRADPLPAIREDAEFPGVKTAIDKLKKGMG